MSSLKSAQTNLDNTRASESETANIEAYEMLKQGFEDEVKFANMEKNEAQQSNSLPRT